MRRWAWLLAFVTSAIGVVAACVGDSPGVGGDATDSGAASSSGTTSSGGSSGASSSGASSSGGSSSGSSGDAGMDARPPCDAAVPTRNAGQFTCPDATIGVDPCSGQCCYEATPRCYTAPATCNGISFRCDKRSDCDAGSYCCLSASAVNGTCPGVVTNAGGSTCQANPCDASTQVELCDTPQKCSNGADCTALTVIPAGKSEERHVGGCF